MGGRELKEDQVGTEIQEVKRATENRPTFPRREFDIVFEERVVNELLAGPLQFCPALWDRGIRAQSPHSDRFFSFLYDTSLSFCCG